MRKNLRKAEEEAEVILREGEKVLEKGIETTNVGIETAEKEIVTAELEIGTVASFGVAADLAQARVMIGAEVVGVLVAYSIVNGILGPKGTEPLNFEEEEEKVALQADQPYDGDQEWCANNIV
ncbi:hypothetical protein CKAN_01420400 [Cinnamomum micranthum f. kanehirae]|uniref:Uncharacterized protein n=1 Tax=Cinnamomum micranthum f. kanehirae TaxID=337451 RepID=A0A443P3P1_9MAGN|nr:hypothetical protein CKAN_01420400 [Cinnamomum micranthum f. kanehirae]